MDIGVPSRFACLKIEDDESRSSSTRNYKKHPIAKKASITENKKTSSSNNKAKLQSSKKSSKSKPKETKQQWDDWKKKDDELVNDNFEEDLKCAMLQSKLDYEKQKRNVISTQKGENSNVKKKKGKTTMSLDQFLDNGNTTDTEAKGNGTNIICEENGNFFDDMLEKAKTEITREKVEENRRKRNEDMEKIISVSHYQEKLEEEIAKNLKLQADLNDAKKEISRVKKRNTTLCSMLSQGEMKEKAEVLLELERLKNVKEELTEEVARLHKLLEQERSNKASSTINPENHPSKHPKDKHIKKKKN